jgi:hypothetical protein
MKFLSRLVQIKILVIRSLLISRSQIDSKSGVNKKGTERLHFWNNFYSLSRVVFTLQGVKTAPLKELNKVKGPLNHYD